MNEPLPEAGGKGQGDEEAQRRTSSVSEDLADERPPGIATRNKPIKHVNFGGSTTVVHEYESYSAPTSRKGSSVGLKDYVDPMSLLFRRGSLNITSTTGEGHKEKRLKATATAFAPKGQLGGGVGVQTQSTLASKHEKLRVSQSSLPVMTFLKWLADSACLT